VILATAPAEQQSPACFRLSVRGKLVVVGGSGDPIPVNEFRSSLVPLGRWKPHGKTIETQDTLDFSVLTNVRPMIETLPLEKPKKRIDA